MKWIYETPVIIQGITELQSSSYISSMQACGTQIAAGVNSGKGGTIVEDIPVFDLVEEAVAVAGKLVTSLIFVHPYEVLDAAREAIDAGIKQIIILTSNVPPLDIITLLKYATVHHSLILGPGSQGLLVPEKVCWGKLQPQLYQPGTVGSIGSSNYLSYEIARELNRAGMGQSLVVDLGNDAILGSGLAQWLPILNEDPHTEAIVYVGREITDIEAVTDYYRNYGYNKPLVIYLVGQKIPQEKKFRDATTIITNHLSVSIPTANPEKPVLSELSKVGIKIAKYPQEITSMLKEVTSNE
jgi:succinyl-CoA synthetase alpha subunit